VDLTCFLDLASWNGRRIQMRLNPGKWRPNRF
jgi:hypothetical protein